MYYGAYRHIRIVQNLGARRSSASVPILGPESNWNSAQIAHSLDFLPNLVILDIEKRRENIIWQVTHSTKVAESESKGVPETNGDVRVGGFARYEARFTNLKAEPMRTDIVDNYRFRFA